MKRRRHTPEQIVRKLREAERLLGEGQTIAEAAEAGRDLGTDLAPLAQPVRRDEGRRRQTAARTGARERPAEADRRRQGTRDRPRSRRSPGETGKPVAPARGSLHVAGPPRVVGTAGMPGHRPAPLHTAPPPDARPRRRRAADGTTRLLAWPPPLGVPPGVGDIARGGLGRESQAGTTALARGGAARPG